MLCSADAGVAVARNQLDSWPCDTLPAEVETRQGGNGQAVEHAGQMATPQGGKDYTTELGPQSGTSQGVNKHAAAATIPAATPDASVGHSPQLHPNLPSSQAGNVAGKSSATPNRRCWRP